MSLLLSLLACDFTEGPSKRARLPHDSADTGATDSAPASGGQDSGASQDLTQVCYLGPERNGDACVPTVPWDASMGAEYVWPDPFDAQYPAPTRLLDLDAIDAALPIAPNFALNELAESWKGRWAVVQPHLLVRLQAMRDALGGPLIVTSGFRSPAYNASVGGVEWSRHQWGDAADLDAEGLSVEALREVCAAHGASYVGLYEDGHTHCDWRDDPLDPVFFGEADQGGGDTGIATAARRAAPAGSRSRGPLHPSAPAPTARLVAAGGAWTAPPTGFDEGEPLRRWTAYDADGAVLLRGEGRSFAAPAGAARFDVTVGGVVRLEGPPPR